MSDPVSFPTWMYSVGEYAEEVSDPDANPNRNVDSHEHGNGYTHQYRYASPDEYADEHVNPDADQYSNGNANQYGNPDRDRDPDQYGNRDANEYGNGYPDQYRYTDGNRNANSYPNAVTPTSLMSEKPRGEQLQLERHKYSGYMQQPARLPQRAAAVTRCTPFSLVAQRLRVFGRWTRREHASSSLTVVYTTF